MQNPSQVITKTRILDLTSEDTPDCMESSLKVHVSNLRRKLREITGKDYMRRYGELDLKCVNNDLTVSLRFLNCFLNRFLNHVVLLWLYQIKEARIWITF